MPKGFKIWQPIPKLRGWLLLARTFGHPVGQTCLAISVTVESFKISWWWKPIAETNSHSRFEGLKVLEILPQGSQKQPELPGLDVICSIFVVPIALVLWEVKGFVDGRLAVEDLFTFQHISNSSVHLKGDWKLPDFAGLCFPKIPQPVRDNRSHLGQNLKRVSSSSLWPRLFARKEVSYLFRSSRF